MTLTIRDSREEDMKAVQDIYRFHVLHGLASFEEDAPSTTELARRRSDVLARGLPYLIAEWDGEIIGYSYAAPYRARSAYRFTVENSVYIDNRFSRRGVGRALVSALVERCSAGGWQQMIAVIGDSGNTPSIALHETLGFQLVGVLRGVGYKFGRWVDSVLMQRQLAPDPENFGTRQRQD
jgi:L-amino acid N-acyltransferase YncA